MIFRFVFLIFTIRILHILACILLHGISFNMKHQ